MNRKIFYLAFLLFNLESSISAQAQSSVAIGIDTHLPKTDFASPGIRLAMQGDIYLGNDLFGLDFAIGGARCLKDIYESNGMIEEDDLMLDTCIKLRYGRLAIQRPHYSITPYVALGAQLYNGGERYEYDEENANNWAEKTGVNFGIGMMFDFPIKRHNTGNTQSLRLNPYFSITRYHGSIGIVPTINLSLCWVWGML